MGRVSFRAALAVLVALALLVRLAVILATPEYRPQTDAADYDRHAVAIAQAGDYPQSVLAPGGGPTAFRPPAYPLALAATYAVAGTGDEQRRWDAGRILNALLGALAVALLALLARRLWGRGAALVAGGLAAVHPPLVLVGSSLMAEPLYVALVLTATLAALAQRDAPGGVRWALAAGVLAGLAALTRSNGLIVLLPLALLAWTARPRWSRRALAAPAAMVAAFALTLAPWTVRNAVVLDAFVPVSTQSGFALAGTYNDQAREFRGFRAFWLPPERVAALRPAYRDRSLSEAELSGVLRGRASDYVRQNPGYPAEVALVNGLRALNLQGPEVERYLAPFEGYPEDLATASVYAFWVLAAIALAGAFTRAARAAPRALWLLALVLGFSSVLFLGLTRYRAPADPYLILLATAALMALRRRRDAALPSPG